MESVETEKNGKRKAVAIGGAGGGGIAGVVVLGGVLAVAAALVAVFAKNRRITGRSIADKHDEIRDLSEKDEKNEGKTDGLDSDLLSDNSQESLSDDGKGGFSSDTCEENESGFFARRSDDEESLKGGESTRNINRKEEEKKNPKERHVDNSYDMGKMELSGIDTHYIRDYQVSPGVKQDLQVKESSVHSGSEEEDVYDYTDDQEGVDNSNVTLDSEINADDVRSVERIDKNFMNTKVIPKQVKISDDSKEKEVQNDIINGGRKVLEEKERDKTHDSPMIEMRKMDDMVVSNQNHSINSKIFLLLIMAGFFMILLIRYYTNCLDDSLAENSSVSSHLHGFRNFINRVLSV